MSAPSGTLPLRTLFSEYLSRGYQIKSISNKFDTDDVESRKFLGTEVVVWINEVSAEVAEEDGQCGCCQDLISNILYAFSCGACGSPCWGQDKEGSKRREVSLIIDGRHQFNTIQSQFQAFQAQGLVDSEASPLLPKKKDDAE